MARLFFPSIFINISLSTIFILNKYIAKPILHPYFNKNLLRYNLYNKRYIIKLRIVIRRLPNILGSLFEKEFFVALFGKKLRAAKRTGNSKYAIITKAHTTTNFDTNIQKVNIMLDNQNDPDPSHFPTTSHVRSISEYT